MYPCTNRDGEREQSQNHSAVSDSEKNNFDHVPCVPVQDCCQTKIKNLNQQQQRSIHHHHPSSCPNSSSYEQLEERVKTLEKELHFLRAKSRKDDEWKRLIQNWIYQQHEQKLRDFKNQLSQLAEFDADPDLDVDRPLFNTRVHTATSTRCHSAATFQSSQHQQEDGSGGGNGSCSQSQLFKPSYSRCDTTSATNTTSMEHSGSGSGSTSSPCTIPGPAVQLEPKTGSSETCSQINHRHNTVGRYNSSNAVGAGSSQESALSGFFLPIPMNPLSTMMLSPIPASTAEAPMTVTVPLPIDGQQRGAQNTSPSFHSSNSTSSSSTNSQFSPQLKISSIRTVTYPAPSSVESATSSTFGKDPLPPTTPFPYAQSQLALKPSSVTEFATATGTGTGNVIFPASNIFIANSSSCTSVTSKISITEDDVIEISDDSEDEDSLLENDMEMEFCAEQDQDQDSCQPNDKNFSTTYFHVGYGTELKTELMGDEAAALGPEQNLSDNGRIVTDSILNKPAQPSSVSISANFNSVLTIATTSEAEAPSDACKDKDSGGKSKPRVCRDWRKICTYPTFQGARNDIMSSKAYTYRCKTESGCGTKTVYACKWYQKTRCPVALYVLQPTTEEPTSGSGSAASSSGLEGEVGGGGSGGTSSDQVSVYETIGIVHNHTNYNARKACSGPGGGLGVGGMRTDSNTGSTKKRQVRLSGEVQNIVRCLFAEGIRKPTGLMAAISKRCPEIKIEMSHLKLFVIRLKQEYAQESA